MEQSLTGHGRGFTSYSMISENRAAIWIPLKDDSAGQSMDSRWAVEEGPLDSVCSGGLDEGAIVAEAKVVEVEMERSRRIQNILWR